MRTLTIAILAAFISAVLPGWGQTSDAQITAKDRKEQQTDDPSQPARTKDSKEGQRNTPSDTPSPPTTENRPSGDVFVNLQTPGGGQQEQGWIRYVASLLFTWQFIFALLFLYLLFSKGAPRRIEQVFRPFRSMKLFGAEFVLNEEVGRTANDSIAAYRKQVQREFDERLQFHRVTEKHEVVVDDYLQPTLDGFEKLAIRTTVQMQDILFAETLYQLLDYYPAQPNGGRGRVFSSRFGMIGKSWRLGQSDYEGSVPTERRRLILEWGMTAAETPHAGHGRESFGAVILQNSSNTAIAIFYLDSPVKQAFGDNEKSEKWQQVKNAILKGCDETGLTVTLDKIRDELGTRSRLIRIHE